MTKKYPLIDNNWDDIYYSHGGNNKLYPYITDNVIYERTLDEIETRRDKVPYTNNKDLSVCNSDYQFKQPIYSTQGYLTEINTSNIIDDIYNNIDEYNNYYGNYYKKPNQLQNKVKIEEVNDKPKIINQNKKEIETFQMNENLREELRKQIKENKRLTKKLKKSRKHKESNNDLLYTLIIVGILIIILIRNK